MARASSSLYPETMEKERPGLVCDGRMEGGEAHACGAGV